ncbi:hypothetical protein BS78_08G132500 [Paspalum vaginatum]|nr:hypothetical protein BS78_08G132500 [Paspalum vaginatum]
MSRYMRKRRSWMSPFMEPYPSTRRRPTPPWPSPPAPPALATAPASVAPPASRGTATPATPRRPPLRANQERRRVARGHRAAPPCSARRRGRRALALPGSKGRVGRTLTLTSTAVSSPSAAAVRRRSADLSHRASFSLLSGSEMAVARTECVRQQENPI